MHLLRGVGVPHVYLIGGVHVVGEGEDAAVSYERIDDLYHALGRTIALREAGLGANELRFLRKRLNMSQGQLAAVVGKTDQAVAKWEKGQNPVPKAEAILVRMLWLVRFAPGAAKQVLERVLEAHHSPECFAYVFRYSGGHWAADEGLACEVSSEVSVVATQRVISTFMTTTLGAGTAGPSSVPEVIATDSKTTA